MGGGRTKSVFVAVILGFVAVVGCGSNHPRAAEDTGQPNSNTTGGKSVFNTDGGPTTPPGCGTKDDGTACQCVDAPLFIDPPTMYFVLDRSGSMGVDDKWTQVRITVADVMRSIGPRANFGATVFPSRSQSCEAGVEALPVTNGDPPSSGHDGPAVTALIAATAYLPSGSTPTAATLEAVRTRLSGVAGRRYVILATDGGPNCGTESCNSSQCQANIDHYVGNGLDCQPNGSYNCCASSPSNCNDANATLDAVSALRSAGIPVYVVGLPGTQAQAYVDLLDQAAVQGGTAQAGSPRYFAVNSNDSTVLLAALRKVAAEITGTCTFDLKAAPIDPSLVNVYMDDVVLPFEPVNGWTLTDKTVTLVGNACTRVKTGNALDVRIIAGCPTILPK